MTIAEQTVEQWLEELAETPTSDQSDAKRMQGLLHFLGYEQAVVICGIVYLEGQGTPASPPTDIHLVAKLIINTRRVAQARKEK